MSKPRFKGVYKNVINKDHIQFNEAIAFEFLKIYT